MMEGWVKLHRKFIGWEWYRDNNTKSLFLHLLLKSNHKDNKWQGQLVKRGQVITGRKSLSNETGLSEQSIRTSLKKLESSQEITIKTTNKNSLITLINYDFYQNDERSNQQDNQQLTNNQPTINQQLTTNNNDNNTNNEKESKEEIISSESERVIKATKMIAEFFSISEIRQPKHYMAIGNFVRCQENKGNLDYLATQFTAYSIVKEKNPEFKHTWYNYIGTPESSYEDGQWNIKNWEESIPKENYQPKDNKTIKAIERTKQLIAEYDSYQKAK